MITSLIFFPEREYLESPRDYGLEYEEVFLTTEDGVKIFGWWLPAKNGDGPSKRNVPSPPEDGSVRFSADRTVPPVLLFLHGNAGNISQRLYKAKGWVDRGFFVFLLDYRGFGQSEGAIQKGEDLMRDARAALKWVMEKHSNIILYGESLGSHPAVRLAAEDKVGAVILEAPYTSFLDLGSLHYPWLPKLMRDLLIRDFAFDNLRWIERLKVPLFILHGRKDEVSPFWMGEKLFQKAPDPKEMFSIEEGDHNGLPAAAGEDYWNKPRDFLLKYL